MNCGEPLTPDERRALFERVLAANDLEQLAAVLAVCSSTLASAILGKSVSRGTAALLRHALEREAHYG